MAQKKSQVQNFEKAFDYTLFLGKYLPTFKCSSQNSTSVDTLFFEYKNQILTLCTGGKKDILDIVSNHSEQSATTYDPNSEETTNNDCDDYDEDNFETALESFEAYTSKFLSARNAKQC